MIAINTHNNCNKFQEIKYEKITHRGQYVLSWEIKFGLIFKKYSNRNNSISNSNKNQKIFNPLLMD